MGEFSLPHILIVLVIVLVFFGPSRLPGLGKSLGEAIRGFKQGIGGDGNADQQNSASQQQINQPVQPTALHASQSSHPQALAESITTTPISQTEAEKNRRS